MTAAAEPCLLQEFLECRTIGILDKTSQAALRLCSKQIKDYIDATIIKCRINVSALHALLKCNWPLTEIEIVSNFRNAPRSPAWSKYRLFHLFRKFPLLHRLLIDGIEELQELPENIGELSQLKDFKIDRAIELKSLPPSFGQTHHT